MLLLDSNIIIYSIEPGYQHLRDYLEGKQLCISKISKIEVLGYQQLSKEEKENFSKLFDSIDQIPITDKVISTSINLRQRKKMSLGDAIIAASAIDSNATLITANAEDFKWIDEIKIHNPLA